MTARCSRYALLLLLAAAALSAQENPREEQKAEEHFRYALGLFERGAYADAAESFARLLRAYPSCHRASAAYVMCAKAYLRAGNPAAADDALKPLFIRFPRSLYLDEALLISARARAQQGAFREAALACAVACARSRSDSIRDEAARMLGAEILTHLTAAGFDSVRARIPDREAEWSLLCARARAMLERGNFDAAREAAKEASAIRAAPELTALRAAIDRESGRSAEAYKVVFIHPDAAHNPAAAPLVEDLYRGVRTAFSREEAGGGIRIDIVRLAFTGDTALLASQLAYLARNPQVLALIGGAYSDDTRRIAEVAARFSFPFLAPTATADGIAATGGNVYQCNADYATRGAAMATYARANLGARRCAILAPLDGYGKYLAEGFSGAARALGMSVEVVSWFRVSDVSLANQIYTIRRALSIPDTVDALYAPIARHEQAAEVAELCLRQGLRCRILGSGDWNDPEILRTIPAAALPIDFEGDYLAEEGNPEWSAFTAAYARLFREPRTRNTFLGYDAAAALDAALHGGRLGRAAIRERLAGLHGARGLRGPITFSRGRVENSVPVFRYENGRIIRITDIHSGE